MTDLVETPSYRLTDRRSLDYWEDERLPDVGYVSGRSRRRELAAVLVEPAARAVIGADPLPAAVTMAALAKLRDAIGRLDAEDRRIERSALRMLLENSALAALDLRARLGDAEGLCAGGISRFGGRPERCRFKAKSRVEIGTLEAPVSSVYCKRHADRAAEYAATGRFMEIVKRLGLDEPGRWNMRAEGVDARARWELLRGSDSIARIVLSAEEVDAIEAPFVERWGAIEV